MDSSILIQNGGLFIVALLVYSTTGLFFCFFLPSGALLFTAGMLAATGSLPYGLATLTGVLSVAAFAGNLTGYLIGQQIGPVLYRKTDTWYFRRKHLQAAEAFYSKYGGPALVAGYFLPIIRSFSPVMAGMIRLGIKRFVLFSLPGAVGWILSFAGAGYFIGGRPLLRPWLPYILTGFIAVVTVPLLVRIIRQLRKGS